MAGPGFLTNQLQMKFISGVLCVVALTNFLTTLYNYKKKIKQQWSVIHTELLQWNIQLSICKYNVNLILNAE